MGKFSSILFVADKAKGEKAALGKIMELAAATGASVTVMDVLAGVPDNLYVPNADLDIADLYEGMWRDRQTELEQLVRAVRRKGGPQPSVLLAKGIDYIEIIRQVKAGKHDLLAKASDNNTALSGVLFGTLDMHLLRKCPCPVFIIKPRKRISHARVLAAVDLSKASTQREELDKAVVDTAAYMAGLEEGSFDLIHAWHLAFEKKLRNEERIRSYKTVEVMLRELRDIEKGNLDLLARTYAALAPRTHLVKGLPQQVIPRFVKAHRVDLLVMGSVGRSGVGGFFIGNTAEKILYALSCSVLAIKPRGFKTPVK